MPCLAVTIRRAIRADIEPIIRLLIDDGLGKHREDLTQPLNPAYLEAFDALDADPNQLLAVADRNGEVVGTLQLTFIPGLSRTGTWRGQIEAVRIADSMRGQGLGHYLIDWAVEQCRERGCRLVQLTSDKKRTDAHRFYERLGFTASHEGFKKEI